MSAAVIKEDEDHITPPLETGTDVEDAPIVPLPQRDNEDATTVSEDATALPTPAVSHETSHTTSQDQKSGLEPSPLTKGGRIIRKTKLIIIKMS
jgi:hypothetical protein